MREVLIGIDLGTTNSLIAKYESGRVVIFKNPIGQKDTLASVVGFRKDRILIGDKAREYLLKDPVNVFGGFKRKMGTDEKFYVVNNDENVTPIQLSSYVLKELISFVPTDEKLSAAVITIPASFDSIQSNATQSAAEVAGIQHVFLLQEPIAAGIAFMNENKAISAKEGHWLVYDLGGGTFDSAILKVENGELNVFGHEGNNFLGGVDFDYKIVEQIILPKIVEKVQDENFPTEFFKKFGKYEKLYLTLILLAEEAKKDLSAMDSTDIEFEVTVENQDYDFLVTITKSDFEGIISDMLDETISLTKKLISNANITNSDINQIILVGGSTLIPIVRKRLAEEFKLEVNNKLDPTTIVAIGAAYYAANKVYDETMDEDKLNILNLDELSKSDVANNTETPIVDVVFNATSMDDEELVIIKSLSNTDQISKYRITRLDGGFDSGYLEFVQKNVQILPLLTGYTNKFELKFFDQDLNKLEGTSKEIKISQGLYNITGQPLPKDICLEIDDLENQCTKLEVIFQKNSILPQKKLVYRQISKKIEKDSDESIVINLLEGDRNSRPISNLPIGKIEIGGKDLESDLFANSDIELSFYMSESRILEVEVFLAMTGQEFKSVFSFTTRNVSIDRLVKQSNELEKEMLEQINKYNSNFQSQESDMLSQLLFEVKSIKGLIKNLMDDSVSDVKYQLAEKLQHLSKEFDNIGGEYRLQQVRNDYLYVKQSCEELLKSLEIGQRELNEGFMRLNNKEASVLKSKSPRFIEAATSELLDFKSNVESYSMPHLQIHFFHFQNFSENSFKDYNLAQSIFQQGEKAISNNNTMLLRQSVLSLYSLMNFPSRISINEGPNFKGTGIG